MVDGVPVVVERVVTVNVVAVAGGSGCDLHVATGLVDSVVPLAVTVVMTVPAAAAKVTTCPAFTRRDVVFVRAGAAAGTPTVAAVASA